MPGKPEKQPQQPEFVQTPAQYLREAAFVRLAARGKQLAAQYRDTLARIEREIGVPGNVVLAIWARETDYGGYKLPLDAIRVLATQAYTGKRKDFFRNEFLHALEDAAGRRAARRPALVLGRRHGAHAISAVGVLQIRGRFRRRRQDRHLAFGAGRARLGRQAAQGQRLARRRALGDRSASAGAGATAPSPSRAGSLPIGEWLQRGYVPAYGRKLSARELAIEASLLLPEGTYGPAFLTPKNYYVLKDYNFSDLYVLFVGHLSDRIAGARPFETPWSKNAQLKTAEVEAMQQQLTALGLYRDKIDGKAGMLTRAALGAYQKTNNLKVDCWPTAAVLAHMRR